MEFFIYLIKTSVALILFYIVYQLLSGMDTFFRLKRILLLFTLFFSALFPFLAFSFDIPNGPGLTTLVTNAIPEYLLKGITVYAGGGEEAGLSLGQVLLSVYIIGVVILSIRMCIEMVSIGRIILRSDKTLLQGKPVYVNNAIKTPFSFFGWIVVNPESHTGDEIKEILLHEETHVREYHSIDTLVSELYCIVFWFNPASWLIKKEVRMNLEYLADRKVIRSGCDMQHYQFHLLRLSYHKAAAKLSNNFNVSPLKQRILMMNKKQTSYVRLAKYALFLPLIIGLIVFNSVKSTASPAGNTEMTANVTVQDDRKVFERAEEMPKYKGGEQALYAYLAENLTYPPKAVEMKVQGTVMLRFIVEKDGSIGEIQVLRGVSPELDAESIRVVEAITDFIPGKQDGEPVAVWFTLPVRYKLP